MNETFVALRNKLNSSSYSLLKKYLFTKDPEIVHDSMTAVGNSLGESAAIKKLLSALFTYENPALNQKIFGINFKNPIGLAAGFDYDAQLTQILPSIGFGFETIGSITLNSYGGNAPPRLARLPKSKSILVNKGLKNKGTKKIISQLKKQKYEIPIGISVAKTNCKENSDDKSAVKDYCASLEICKKANVGDYYEINISCPNAFGGEAFTTPKKLNYFLAAIDELKIKKSVFLKMPVDFTIKKTLALCKIADSHNVQGLIFGNLTKKRNNPLFDKEEIFRAGKGNFSGLPTKEKSNNLIRAVYKKYEKRFVIVGCGGIFTADDAYEKIKAGASLVQLITGMIYRGPGVISEINYKLVKLLEKDGFTNISQAIGVDHKIKGADHKIKQKHI